MSEKYENCTIQTGDDAANELLERTAWAHLKYSHRPFVPETEYDRLSDDERKVVDHYTEIVKFDESRGYAVHEEYLVRE